MIGKIIFISICGFALFIELLKIITLVFHPRSLERFQLISSHKPSKAELLIYYLGMCSILCYAISMKILR